jgi:hypothetical protein
MGSKALLDFFRRSLLLLYVELECGLHLLLCKVEFIFGVGYCHITATVLTVDPSPAASSTTHYDPSPAPRNMTSPSPTTTSPTKKPTLPPLLLLRNQLNRQQQDHWHCLHSKQMPIKIYSMIETMLLVNGGELCFPFFPFWDLLGLLSFLLLLFCEGGVVASQISNRSQNSTNS